MMLITCVDDDRNNNARRSLRLALSSAAAAGSAFSTGAERGDDAQLAPEVLVWGSEWSSLIQGHLLLSLER